MKMETLGYTRLHFGLLDRVRILFGAAPHVTIKTSLDTHTLPDDFTMKTEMYVPRLIPKPQQGVYVEIKEQQSDE